MGIFSSLFRKSEPNPRLSMVSEIRRCKKSDKKLRDMLFHLMKPHDAEHFAASGFPPDDGKRKYLPHEADDKLAYYIDRYFEAAGTSLHWVNTCTDVRKFFIYWDDYVDVMRKLSRFEEYVVFRDPVPSRTLRRFCENEAEIQCALVDRVWNSVLREAQKLKTEDAQNRRMDDVKGSFNPYMFRLTPRATERLRSYLRQLDSASQENTPATTPVMNMQGKEKPMPVFDAEKEKKLLAEYRSDKRPLARHLARAQLIPFYYKYRQDAKYAALCELYCREDIAAIPELDDDTRSREQKRHNDWVKLMGKPSKERQEMHDRTMLQGGGSQHMAFDKLIMLSMNKKDYQSAAEWCQRAIEHQRTHGLPTDFFEKKQITIKKKTVSNK